MSLFEEAKKFRDKGISVVPAHRTGKFPLLPTWKEFQTRLITDEELETVFKKSPDANMGFVTGKLSGFFVIDIEKEVNLSEFQKQYELPPTAIVKTGGGGWHFYYRYPADRKIPTKARMFGQGSPFKVDIRGEGGFIVAPPSIHPATFLPYEWSTDLDDLSDAPSWILEWAHDEMQNVSGKLWENGLEGVAEGLRDSTMTSLVGSMLAKLAPSQWDVACLSTMRELNKKNTPPLSEKDLLKIFGSMKQKEIQRRQKLGIKDEEESLEPFQKKTWKEIRETKYPGIEWVIDKLLPKYGILIVSGPPAAYKSWFTLHTAIAVSEGNDFLGKFKTAKSHVMIIDKENSEMLVANRVLKSSPKEDLPIHLSISEKWKLNEHTVEELLHICKELNISYLIFDSLRQIHNFNENDSKEIAEAFRYLKRLAKEGIGITIIHHHKKAGGYFKIDPSEMMRGSTDILAEVNSHLALEIKEREDGKYLIVRQTKLREAESIPPFQLKIASTDDSFSFDWVGDLNEEETAVENAKEAIIAIFDREPKSTKSKTDIFDILKGEGRILGQHALAESLKELTAEGKLDLYKGDRNKKFYFLKQEAQESEEDLQIDFADGKPLEDGELERDIDFKNSQ